MTRFCVACRGKRLPTVAITRKPREASPFVFLLIPLQAVEFSWDPSDSGLDVPLLTSGVLSIRPFKGKIEAGQSLLLQITLSASCGPQMLGQRPVGCLVWPICPTEVRVGPCKWVKHSGAPPPATPHLGRDNW